MTNKKKLERLLLIFIFVVIAVIIALLGIKLLKPSKAATTIAPQVGINLHAGWSQGWNTDTDNKAIIDKAVEAGMTWVRIDMGWCTIEETGDNQYQNWYLAKLDTSINYAKSKGVKVLAAVHCSPAWATGNTTGNTYIRPKDPSKYGEIAQFLANRYQGRVQAWEVWNEPDPDQKFWTEPPSGTAYGGTANYATLVKVAYSKFKAGDPNALVVVGGPSSNDDGWISELYNNGIKGYFDVLSLHPYNSPANAGPTDIAKDDRYNFKHLPAVRNVMVNNGDSNKPIWITELGWSTHANNSSTKPWNLGVTEQQQADFSVEAIKYAAANWPYVTNIFFYTDKNTGQSDIHQSNFGILRIDNSPKPVWNAIKSYLSSLKQASAPTPSQTTSTTSTAVAIPTQTTTPNKTQTPATTSNSNPIPNVPVIINSPGSTTPISDGSSSQVVTGLTTLSPENINNIQKSQSIKQVDYYNNGKLVQSVTKAPFALDTNKLKNGTANVKEVTILKDGTSSEKYKTLTVTNKKNINILYIVGGIIGLIICIILVTALIYKKYLKTVNKDFISTPAKLPVEIKNTTSPHINGDPGKVITPEKK